MKLKTSGKNTSELEVSNISQHGFWIFVKETEYFIPYGEFPWFKDARVCEILNVELFGDSHLHWPDLDVDLDVASLENPDKYPLIFRAG